MDNKIIREQKAYDEGNVWVNSMKLRNRFHHVFECKNTLKSEMWFRKKTANLCQNKIVLDYGCLRGGEVPFYINQGASKVIGIDISKNGITEAKLKYGDIADFHVCDAHNLNFINDSSIDLVIGRGILHHLNYDKAVLEVLRVLRNGGSALFSEPLYDNPLSKIFRLFTPNARTKDERPLSKKQIEWANSLFKYNDHKFCNLISTPVGMLTSQFPLSPSNICLNAADFFDSYIEKTSIKYCMRSIYIHWIK